MTTKTVLNVGSGDPGMGRISPMFKTWQQIRVDLDPDTQPDVVASIIDLASVPDASVDAVWASHCLEHLYVHEVPQALGAFGRVLKEDGFVCLLVPDLQAAAKAICDDKLAETLYQSASGPVTPRDMVFGFAPAIARGRVFMAHRCGFTPTVLGQTMLGAGFPEVIVQRRELHYELAAVARKKPSSTNQERAALIAELQI